MEREKTRSCPLCEFCALHCPRDRHFLLRLSVNDGKNANLSMGFKSKAYKTEFSLVVEGTSHTTTYFPRFIHILSDAAIVRHQHQALPNFTRFPNSGGEFHYLATLRLGQYNFSFIVTLSERHPSSQPHRRRSTPISLYNLEIVPSTSRKVSLADDVA